MKLKHWLIFFLTGGIFSSSFLWIKIAIQEIGPVILVAFRVLFGLLFGVVVILLQRQKLPRNWQGWYPLLVLGITNVALPFFLISWGEQTIDSAVAAILDATVPLFTIVIAHLTLLDDRITTPKVVGLVTGFAGVVVLMSRGLQMSASSIAGQVAVILASVCYAGSAVYVRKVTEDTPAILRSGIPNLSAVAVMWPAALLFEQPLQIPQLPITWVALLWLGILGSGLAFLMAFYLIHEIGPTRASMITYLFPLGGVILGVTFLQEQLTWQMVTGAALIMAGLVAANWRRAKAPSHSEADEAAS